MIQELRIGNWIMGELGNEMTVCSLYKNSIECDFDGGWCSVFCPKPIPLSKEILEKCGFVSNAIGQLAIEILGIDTHLEVISIIDGYCYLNLNQIGEFGSIQDVSINRIKYLHDLQNLYYALTKQELQYKP